MCERNDVLRLFQKRKRSLFNYPKFVILIFWSCGKYVRRSLIRGFYSRVCLFNYYRAYSKLWHHNRHVHAFLEMDRLRMPDEKSEVLESILTNAIDITSIHRHIKSLKHFSKKSARKALRVNRSDGKPSSSRSEEKHVFRQHFASQLGGSQSTFASSHKSSLESLCDIETNISGIGASAIVPGISELAKLLNSASLGAGGEDRIRGKLCRRFPRVFACLYYPLVFKSSCLPSPPPITVARRCFAGIV